MTPSSNSELYQIIEDKYSNEYYDNFDKKREAGCKEPPMMGVAGEHQFKIQMAGVGKGTIHFVYGRVWDPSTMQGGITLDL